MAKQKGNSDSSGTMRPFSIELYEINTVPGKLIGKAVIDGNAQLIGVIRSIRVQVPPGTVEFVVKGLNIEFTIDSKDIQTIGGVVQLNRSLNHVEPIDVSDVLHLRDEIKVEIKHFLSLLKNLE